VTKTVRPRRKRHEDPWRLLWRRIEEFLAAHPAPELNIALLLTSDEEGPALDGTVVVCKQLQARGEVLDYLHRG